MNLEQINDRGLVVVGAGRMGGALLDGWLGRGVKPGAVSIIDPHAAPLWAERGLRVNEQMPPDPVAVILAVKPQMMGTVLPQLRALGGGGALILSVAAGVTLATYDRAFPQAAIVRAMPNTPAAIGRGITAIIGNARAKPADLDLAEALMAAVGAVVRLDNENQMDAVTAVSGSGPAYVFYLIEALAKAGVAQGLSPALALDLARATVAGAGALAMAGGEDPARLRENVTSPGGTTAAALGVLMDDTSGLSPLLHRAVTAAADRSRELASSE